MEYGLVLWNPKSLHSNQILEYSIYDFYFCVDSIESFGTLEKEVLRSIRRAKALPHNLRYNRKGSCARLLKAAKRPLLLGICTNIIIK